MERRTPLKRGTPLGRGTATLSRATPLQPGKRKQRKRQPAKVLAAIAKRSKGRCVVCGAKCDARHDRHHVLPVERWPALERMAENQVLACIDCHMNHEAASRRIRWAELPECAITLAYATSGAAAVYIERTYPR